MQLNFKFPNGTEIDLNLGVESIIGGLLGAAIAQPALEPKRKKKKHRRAKPIEVEITDPEEGNE